MAWSYFGKLYSSDHELIDDQSEYCRICVASGDLGTKYKKSSSTATLFHHIYEKHVGNKKKRKRFREADDVFEESSLLNLLKQT